MSDTPATTTGTTPRKRKQPLLPPQFIKAMLAGHSALGLAFAALIYVVCLTGTLCVFLHDVMRWEQPNAPLVTTVLEPAAINRAAQASFEQATTDGARDEIFITAPGALSPRFAVTYHVADPQSEGEWIADANGRLVTRIHAPWSEFVGSLHMNLHLPRTWGLFLVGLTGVALLSSLISGLLSHPRIFKDAFAMRWGEPQRMQEADLHNRLGVWGLPFHFVVSLTGALLGLSTLIVGVLALAAYDGDSEKAFSAILGPRATVSDEAAPLPDIASLIETAKKHDPDAEFVSAELQRPGSKGQLVNISMRSLGHLAFSTVYHFDGNGTLLGDNGFETGSVGQQILGVLQPLHFGWFAGIGTKIIYGILGLALTIITQNGVRIWMARRRDRGLPVPTWERIWAAVVWGQPLALAAAAIASLYLEEKALIPVYVAGIIGSLGLVAAMKDARAVRRSLQISCAATLSLLAILHTSIWWDRITDPVPLWVTAAIVLAAISLAFLAGMRCISSTLAVGWNS